MIPALQIGEINSDACYPEPAFRQVSGLSKEALAASRRRGLRILREGKRSFILGRDWIAYLDAKGRVVAADGTVAAPTA